MVVSSEVLLRWTGGEYVRGDGTFFFSLVFPTYLDFLSAIVELGGGRQSPSPRIRYYATREGYGEGAPI